MPEEAAPNVFISWSKAYSLGAATVLKEFLPDVIQSCRPWMSTEIQAGSFWSDEIHKKLASVQIGILVLTPENLPSPWLHYEAGALVMKLGRDEQEVIREKRVIPLLVNVPKDAVRAPLNLLHMVAADEEGLLKLCEVLAFHIDPSLLTTGRLKRAFDREWPELRGTLDRLAEKQAEQPAPAPIPPEEMADSILQRMKALLDERDTTSQLAPQSVSNGSGRLVPSAFLIRVDPAKRHKVESAAERLNAYLVRHNDGAVAFFPQADDLIVHNVNRALLDSSAFTELCMSISADTGMRITAATNGGPMKAFDHSLPREIDLVGGPMTQGGMWRVCNRACADIETWRVKQGWAKSQLEVTSGTRGLLVRVSAPDFNDAALHASLEDIAKRQGFKILLISRSGNASQLFESNGFFGKAISKPAPRAKRKPRRAT